jgi:hypothetical protein
LSYGPIASPTVPGGAVDVTAGTDIQSVITAHSPGTVYYLRAGVHRGQSFQPKNGDTFVGEFGAILNGSVVLSSWTASGSNFWATVSGFTSPGDGGECVVGGVGGLCTYAGDVYFDGVALERVSTLAAVAVGKFFHDIAANRVYIRSDPSGHTVERASQTTGINGSATGVVLNNLTVEKYANPAQSGAIQMGVDWTVQNTSARLNHGIGVRINSGAIVTGCQFNYNGQMGCGGSGTGALVDSTEIGYSNYNLYDPAWEAGGTKFTSTVDLVVSNCWIHHSAGPGLWLDIDNIDFTLEDNICEDNYSPNASASPGIFIEISYGGIIRNNTCRRNGAGFTSWLWGAGILIAASGGTGLDIYGNIVEDNLHGITLIQQSRGSGTHGTHLVQNVTVHDNTIRMVTGFTGAVQDYGGDAIFDSLGNSFTTNTYHLASGNHFAWHNGERAQAAWQGYTLDVGGTFIYDGGVGEGGTGGTGGGGGGGGEGATSLLACGQIGPLFASALDVTTVALTGNGLADDPSGQFRADLRRASDGGIIVTRNFNYQPWRGLDVDLNDLGNFPQQFPADHTLIMPTRAYSVYKAFVNQAQTIGWISWSTDALQTPEFTTVLQRMDLSSWSITDEWLAIADVNSTATSQKWWFIGVTADESTAYYLLVGGPNVQNQIYAINIGTGANSTFATIGSDVGGTGVPRDNLLFDGVVLANGQIVVGAFNTDGFTNDTDGHVIHVVDTDGTILSSTPISFLQTPISTQLQAFVEDHDGTVWATLAQDSLIHFDPSTGTVLSQVELPPDGDAHAYIIKSLQILDAEVPVEPPATPIAVPLPTPAAPQTNCAPQSQTSTAVKGQAGCNDGGKGFVLEYTGDWGAVPEHPEPPEHERLTGKDRLTVEAWVEVNTETIHLAMPVQLLRANVPLADDSDYEGGSKTDGLLAIGDVEHALGNEQGGPEATTVDVQISGARDNTIHTDADDQDFGGAEVIVKLASDDARASHTTR